MYRNIFPYFHINRITTLFKISSDAQRILPPRYISFPHKAHLYGINTSYSCYIRHSKFSDATMINWQTNAYRIFSQLTATSFIFAHKPDTHKPASHFKLLSRKWRRRSGRCDKNKTVSRGQITREWHLKIYRKIFRWMRRRLLWFIRLKWRRILMGSLLFMDMNKRYSVALLFTLKLSFYVN